MIIYTIPMLKSHDDLTKSWYVWFSYNGKLIKKSGEINRIKNAKQRMNAGLMLAK